MAVSIRAVEYYYLTVKDIPGTAYDFLAQLTAAEVNLLAFHIVPTGLEVTQLTVFPANPRKLKKVAKEKKLSISGTQHAFLIQGDDELGALTQIHQKLAKANINVFASSGVTDGSNKRFGYIVHVREGAYNKAKKILGVK